MPDQTCQASCRHPSSSATWPASAMASSSCWAPLVSAHRCCLCGTFTAPSSASNLDCSDRHQTWLPLGQLVRTKCTTCSTRLYLNFVPVVNVNQFSLVFTVCIIFLHFSREGYYSVGHQSELPYNDIYICISSCWVQCNLLICSWILFCSFPFAGWYVCTDCESVITWWNMKDSEKCLQQDQSGSSALHLV